MMKTKHFFSIILAAIMLLCCTSAYGEVDPSDLWGTWIENDGFGTLTIFTDNTSIMNYYDGTVTECEWAVTEEGAKFTTGQWLNSPMELIDENTLNVANGWMVFTREGAEMSQPELNPVPVGDEGAAYFGSWTLETIRFDDESYDASTIGMNMGLTFNEDGTVVSTEDGETNTSVWSIEDGYAIVDGTALYVNDNGDLVFQEGDDMMLFVRGESEQAAELSEDEQLLALLELLAQTSDEEDSLFGLPENLQGFVGQWHMVYTATGGLTGDLRTMGVTCELTLNANGSGSISFPTAEEGYWYDDEGVVRFGESGMPMTLLEGGFLQYGSEMGGYMIFSQDAEAVFEPAALTPAQAEEQPAADPAVTATFTSNEEYLGKKFVAATYTMAGQTYDASMLGMEYSLLFRENGTCDFGMAGMFLTDLPWGLSQVAVGLNQVEAFAINYYGAMFNAVPTPTGFDMDYYGTMTLHFVPAE